MSSARRTSMILVAIIIAASLTGCSSCSGKHYVDVYINDACTFVQQGTVQTTVARGVVVMDPLWVFPGDYVSWANIGENTVTLTFTGNEDVFGELTITIAPGHRVILPVEIDSSRLIEVTLNCSGDSGTPKVNVGDDP